MTAPAGLEHQWHVPRHRDGSRTGKLEISFSFHIEAADDFLDTEKSDLDTWIG